MALLQVPIEIGIGIVIDFDPDFDAIQPLRPKLERFIVRSDFGYCQATIQPENFIFPWVVTMLKVYFTMEDMIDSSIYNISDSIPIHFNEEILLLWVVCSWKLLKMIYPNKDFQ